MTRLEQIRGLVNSILAGVTDLAEKSLGYAHLYGVSGLGVQLALKRGLDPELAAVCGLLHDVYSVRTGLAWLHDQNGAEYMRPILRDLGTFSPEEQTLILSALFHHSDKAHVHTPYDEMLKDSDVLQHFLTNPFLPLYKEKTRRLVSILNELGLPYSIEEGDAERETTAQPLAGGTRARLADLGEALAGKIIEGVPRDQDFQAICRYWPDKNIFLQFKGSWCAAFVYHCCMQAGFVLPIRHPLVPVRFAGVRAWLMWAQLAETGFFHSVDGFVPRRGDIVIFEQLYTESPHDHIGIVLAWDGSSMTAAEGNAGNQNRSALVNRSCRENIAGFIRIENGYRYEPGGRSYIPPEELT